MRCGLWTLSKDVLSREKFHQLPGLSWSLGKARVPRGLCGWDIA